MHGHQGDEIERPFAGATPRQVRLLWGLVDLSERLHAGRDVHADIRVATEGARDLLGARRAATSVVLDPRHPRPIHFLATAEGPRTVGARRPPTVSNPPRSSMRRTGHPPNGGRARC